MAGGIPHQNIDFMGIANMFLAAKDAGERRAMQSAEMARQKQIDAQNSERIGWEREDRRLAAENRVREQDRADKKYELDTRLAENTIKTSEAGLAANEQARNQARITPTAQRREWASRLIATDPSKAPMVQRVLDEQHKAGIIDKIDIARPETQMAPGLAGPQIDGGEDASQLQIQADSVLAPARDAERRAKAPEIETSLRKEFQATPEFKAAREVQTAFRKVRGAPSTAVGDMSLIYGVMKMQDPGSTVREGEYANAENAQGVEGRISSLYNRIVKGERLSPEQRWQFKKEAERLYEAQRESIDAAAGKYREIAEKQGANPDFVVLDLWGDDKPMTPAKRSPRGPVTPPRGTTAEEIARRGREMGLTDEQIRAAQQGVR